MGIVSILAGLFAKLAADEIKAWLPIISRRIAGLAVRRLPVTDQARCYEEWQADIMEIRGDLSKLLYSLGLLLAALRIKSEWINRVQRTQKLSRREVEVLSMFYLIDEIANGGEALAKIHWDSLTRLTEKTDPSRPRTFRVIKQLVAKGLLEMRPLGSPKINAIHAKPRRPGGGSQSF